MSGDLDRGALWLTHRQPPTITTATRFAPYGHTKHNTAKRLLHLVDIAYLDWRRDRQRPSLSARWRCGDRNGSDKATLTTDKGAYPMCPMCEAIEYGEAMGAEHGQFFVYYAQRDGLIKIGRSTRVGIRVRNLRAELLAVEPGTSVDECARHHQFAHLRHVLDEAGGTEWFDPGADLLAHIASLGGAA